MKSCSCFPWLHLVNIPASSSQGAVRCQICSRRANSKMHVQPLCQDVDVPVMTKKFPETASLFNFIFHGWLVGVLPQWATWASGCWLDCFILSQIYHQGILLQLTELPLRVYQLLMHFMYFRFRVCHLKKNDRNCVLVWSHSIRWRLFRWIYWPVYQEVCQCYCV